MSNDTDQKEERATVKMLNQQEQDRLDRARERKAEYEAAHRISVPAFEPLRRLKSKWSVGWDGNRGDEWYALMGIKR